LLTYHLLFLDSSFVHRREFAEVSDFFNFLLVKRRKEILSDINIMDDIFLKLQPPPISLHGSPMEYPFHLMKLEGGLNP
jgi:hypothetical protein